MAQSWPRSQHNNRLIIVCGSIVCVTVDFRSGAAQPRFFRHHALFALEMPLIQSVLSSNVNSNNSSFLGGLTTKAERLISLRRTTVMPWATRDCGVTELLSIPFLLAYKDDPRFIAFAQKVGVMPKAAASP